MITENLKNMYQWEMEDIHGTILQQYDDNGNEQSWKQLNPDDVIRVTFKPTVPFLPMHTCVMDLGTGERFIRRFASGFKKLTPEGIVLKQYINCAVTNRYRMYVFADGRVLITRWDYELNV